MKSVVISYHFCLYVKKTWKTAHRLWNGEHNGTHPTRCTRHQRIKKEMLDIPAWRLRDYKRKNVWQKKEVWSTPTIIYFLAIHFKSFVICLWYIWTNIIMMVQMWFWWIQSNLLVKCVIFEYGKIYIAWFL